jgi:hypothetical protein
MLQLCENCYYIDVDTDECLHPEDWVKCNNRNWKPQIKWTKKEIDNMHKLAGELCKQLNIEKGE